MAERMLTAAGFGSVEVHQLPHVEQNLDYVRSRHIRVG